MDWQNRKSKYDKLKVLGEQKDDDLLARRLLEGLGIIQKDIWRVEREAEITPAPTDTLWDRACRLVVMKARRNVTNARLIYKELQFEVVPTAKHSIKSIIERLELWMDNKAGDVCERPFIFTRLFESNVGVVMYPLTAEEFTEYLNTDRIRPRFNVILKHGTETASITHYVISQSIVEFVKGACGLS